MYKKLYIAYGSNLNIRQMAFRCPGAKLRGTGTVEDYELQFRGRAHCAFATITPKAGCTVPVAVWEISKENERALDRYEGVPVHYYKETIPVCLGDERLDAMVYLMNPKMEFGLPSPHYYTTVQQGYFDCGLDREVLEKALGKSASRYYAAYTQQELRFDVEDGGEPLEEDVEQNERDPFYFSEGMHL